MNQAKTLWIVTYHFHPVWAGPAERFLRYYDGLTERKLKIVYITRFIPGQKDVDTYNRAPVIRLKGRTQSKQTIREFVNIACSYALKSVPKPDCFLLLLGDVLNAPKIRKLSRSNILTVFVNTMIFIPSRSLNPLRRATSNYLHRQFFNAFDKIVCSSALLREKIQKAGISPTKLFVIPNGVSLDRFRPLKSKSEVDHLRRELGLPLNEKIALYVGLRVDRKGVIDLLSSWKSYKRSGGEGWLVLVGDDQRGNPRFHEFYGRWDAAVSGLNSNDNVLILPATQKVECFFQACDFLIFLSKREGMPNVLFESMASGCPVITTAFEGFSDDIGRHNKELVVVNRTNIEIIEAIKLMVENHDHFHTIRSNAITHVKENHDLVKTLEKYRELCES